MIDRSEGYVIAHEFTPRVAIATTRSPADTVSPPEEVHD
jgi:hypothetical protein